MRSVSTLENITINGIFCIVALDHRNSLRRMLNPQNPQEVSNKMLEDVKYKLSRFLLNDSSAILLDVEYGKKAIEYCKDKEKEVILAIEKSGYCEVNGGRITELLEDCFERVESFGSRIIKLLVYYNPKDKTAKAQRNLIKKVSEECEKRNFTFLCEIVTYPNEKMRNKKELVLTSVKEVSKLGMDVLKIEAPGESLEEMKESFQELDKLSKVPWILLSGGMKFESFRDVLGVAVNYGCSGFAVGRALWQDCIKNGSVDENFVKRICVPRLRELKKIALNGRPWFLKI